MIIEEMLAYNKQFVAEKRYEQYAASKYPNKKIASLLVAIIELGVEEIMVIGHTDCGVQHIDSDIMIHHMKQRGISQESIDLMKYCGIDFEKWLAGFDTVEQSVTDTVETIRNHPLMPHDIRIGGYVIDSITGEVSTVCKAE